MVSESTSTFFHPPEVYNNLFDGADEIIYGVDFPGATYTINVYYSFIAKVASPPKYVTAATIL
jgi:hypothetical protein